MASRNEPAAAGGQDKETTKLNQIIQVRAKSMLWARGKDD